MKAPAVSGGGLSTRYRDGGVQARPVKLYRAAARAAHHVRPRSSRSAASRAQGNHSAKMNRLSSGGSEAGLIPDGGSGSSSIGAVRLAGQVAGAGGKASGFPERPKVSHAPSGSSSVTAASRIASVESRTGLSFPE